MPKLKLSAAAALAAHCEPGKKKTDWYDDGSNCTGLVLEKRASGNATWYLRYQDGGGRLRQIKLARLEDATFDQIRKKARRLRSEVVLGGDPAAAKALERAVPTYGELADQHLAHARTHLRSIKTLEGYLKRIRARWGKVRLTDVRGQEVAAWLAELRAQGLAPATVLKTLVTMSRSFQLGASWGVPGADPNPLRSVPRPRVANARETYVDGEQAARLIEAARATRNPQAALVIELLLLTGMRVSELLSARWEDVDLTRRALFVPTSKNGRSRHVPLSQAALDAVGRLPRAKGAVYLFPSPKDATKHLTTIKHAWQTARAAAGLPALRIHDLRHSAASAMINAGVDLYSVGKILGHQSHASTARYSHVATTTLLAAVEAGAARLKLDRAA